MKVNIEISEGMHSQLKTVKNLMLIWPYANALYCIQDFSVEEILVNGGKTIFNKQRPLKKKLILNNISVLGYHRTGKFLGFLNGDSFQHFLSHDLYGLRNAFIEFEEQLKAFGLEIKKIEPSEIKEETKINL